MPPSTSFNVGESKNNPWSKAIEVFSMLILDQTNQQTKMDMDEHLPAVMTKIHRNVTI